jgi:hypothetical protein
VFVVAWSDASGMRAYRNEAGKATARIPESAEFGQVRSRRKTWDFRSPDARTK